MNRHSGRQAKDQDTRSRVKMANRRLYDAIAGAYEEIDGRRSPRLEMWLRGKLENLRRSAPGGRLLDIGSGSGFVTRCAESLFSLRVGTDMSSGILVANSQAFDAGVAADVDHLPFSDGSFDVVTCFAVLHHLYSFDDLVMEAARVLKPGGLFYSDHDIDSLFCRRFRLPLAVYRRLRDSGSKYREASEQITDELYHLAEWQEKGINASSLASLFANAGFSVESSFHWFGLASITDRVFGERLSRHGWAPLVSLTCRKNGE
ncbi:MAG: class I SAM-dependent methyltransferase [Candidatus Abyssobacteria bacterium SURF_5]|uniref:Class I SAM-dependent methyltransferase n=1 Tax=Abyssobacteria bacterium (strain SURF_5) TaxID=2093360 RepID=A0A3A4NRQ6_ABYX5|nr:MAG: class I SAM-dependent methyltransferase [Candidatus Abyssubacteria bacterium SURF_5]